MNYKMMGRFIGKILMVEGAFMVPALFISLYGRELAAVRAFLWSMAIIFAVAVLLTVLCRGSKTNFMRRKDWPVWVSVG